VGQADEPREVQALASGHGVERAGWPKRKFGRAKLKEE